MSFEARSMSVRRRPKERGSALLIVFVFAAMAAIMLYSELPIAVFEAKRQKEQLLIDRGNEYAHAVKLYVRKFGTYPTTVDQLENTNRMRFLRHRFKDPFTGKDNWRMLHAGPGGQLTDSKVKPQGLGNIPGNSSGSNSPSNSGSSFGSTSSGSSFGSGNTNSALGSSGATASSGFGSSSLGQSGFGSASSGSGEAVVVPDLPQRPPAIPSNGLPASGTGTGETASAPAEGGESPTTSLLPEGTKDSMNELAQGEPGTSPQNAGQSANGQAAASIGPPGQSNPAGAADGQNPMDTVRKMLNNPAIGAPLAGSGNNTGPSSTMGQISGGGIAGVASIAKGHTIKVVNDQSDYSLWEFYYDPTKDATRNMPGLANGAQGAGRPGANGANPASSTGVGQSLNQSGFGQSTPGAAPAGTASAPSNPQQ